MFHTTSGLHHSFPCSSSCFPPFLELFFYLFFNSDAKGWKSWNLNAANLSTLWNHESLRLRKFVALQYNYVFKIKINKKKKKKDMLSTSPCAYPGIFRNCSLQQWLDTHKQAQLSSLLSDKLRGCFPFFLVQSPTSYWVCCSLRSRKYHLLFAFKKIIAWSPRGSLLWQLQGSSWGCTNG